MIFDIDYVRDLTMTMSEVLPVLLVKMFYIHVRFKTGFGILQKKMNETIINF